jgi:hypothetical protein
VAAALFSQALAGEPELAESLPKPIAGGVFGFAATLAGDREGRFAVVLDAALLGSPLLGEGVDQKAGWSELLREVADAAAGELLAKTGAKCRVEKFEEIAAESKASRAFQLQCGERSFAILVRDEVRALQRRSRRHSTRASNCCSTLSSRPLCALAAGRCRWASCWTWARGTWCNWIAMSPIRWI